jgi:hypothetical protein
MLYRSMRHYGMAEEIKETCGSIVMATRHGIVKGSAERTARRIF